MHIVLHVELVLHEVGVGIDGLVLILRQLLSGEHLRHPVVVVGCLPLGAVAACASPLIEELLALLHIGVVEVTGTRNGQSAVPHHEGVELVGRLLRLELEPRVVELVGARAQQVVNTSLDAVYRSVAIVRRCGV